MTTTSAMKQILVKIVGEEKSRTIQVDLAPGASVADLLDQADLEGYQLTDPKTGTHFQPIDNIYDRVAHGQKVFAARTDDLSAGASQV